LLELVHQHPRALADLRREHLGSRCDLLQRHDLLTAAAASPRASTSSGSFLAAKVRSRSEYANMNALSNRTSRISASVCW
jgi:hypothetical protein